MTDAPDPVSNGKQCKPPVSFLLRCCSLAFAPGSPLQPAHRNSSPSASAQHISGKRLILKDGSYQIVTKWEVKGDRVRYYSAERAEWEEVPYNLIDWPATNKWNKEHEPGAQPSPAAPNPPVPRLPAEEQKEAAAIDAEAAAERADQRARTPLVAPGLHLPDQDGIFVLDNFQSIPELVHLDQSTGNVNRDASHNVLRAAIDFLQRREGTSPHQWPGCQRTPPRRRSCAVRQPRHRQRRGSRARRRPDGQHPRRQLPDKNEYSSPDSRYAIVRVDVQPGERVIGALRISRAGNATQSEDIVPTKAEILTGKHWMKLTPKEPLPIGEYALMEILAPGVINLDVWDFGVSPNAPENKHPITPVKDGP